VVRPGGVHYYPYGATQGTGFLGFTIYGGSPSGLSYANQRYYSSLIGRFTTPDPYMATTETVNNPADPQSWNRFSYVLNDPVNLVDPAGMMSCQAGDAERTGGGLHCSPSPADQKQSPKGPAKEPDIGGANCDAPWFAASPVMYPGPNGRVFGGSDLNIAARLVYAESTTNSLERSAVASVIFNRLGNPTYGNKTTFAGLASSGQFQAASKETPKWKNSSIDNYQNLSEKECDSLKGAIATIQNLMDSGPQYTFIAFRAGVTPLKDGMIVIGRQRFADDESVFF
jgi:RHS repeat-associated protein